MGPCVKDGSLFFLARSMDDLRDQMVAYLRAMPGHEEDHLNVMLHSGEFPPGRPFLAEIKSLTLVGDYRVDLTQPATRNGLQRLLRSYDLVPSTFYGHPAWGSGNP